VLQTHRRVLLEREREDLLGERERERERKREGFGREGNRETND
jgi:hypothetical protein